MTGPLDVVADRIEAEWYGAPRPGPVVRGYDPEADANELHDDMASLIRLVDSVAPRATDDTPLGCRDGAE